MKTRDGCINFAIRYPFWRLPWPLTSVLDSNVIHHRKHKFCLENGFDIVAHLFLLKLHLDLSTFTEQKEDA
jgi:hypothetical protein